MLGDDTPALELDGREHDALAADEATGEIDFDLFFGHIGPTKERCGVGSADGVRHGLPRSAVGSAKIYRLRASMEDMHRPHSAGTNG